MACNQCGAEVPVQAAFCPKCGAQLGAAASENPNRPVKAERLQAGVAQGTARDVPEDELWEGGYSPKAMTPAFIGAALLTIIGGIAASFAGPIGWIAVAIGAALVFGYLLLSLLYNRYAVRYRLTTHRLVITRGILSRVDDRILLVDVDDITVQQGFIERLFSIGTITLHTTDETTKEKSPDPDSPNRGIVVMKGIENPRPVGDTIDEARRSERSRRGVYMMDA
jgi:membrane protein YdbS with pleckstrin-like domain